VCTRPFALNTPYVKRNKSGKRKRKKLVPREDKWGENSISHPEADGGMPDQPKVRTGAEKIRAKVCDRPRTGN
jgi:hypothetical protein